MTKPPIPAKLAVNLALAVAGIGVLACLWVAWCEFPRHGWNEMRLAPAFALRLGLNPYPPLGGGPLSTWIYGPVGILLNLPATFAPTAERAVQIACLINALVVIGPLAVIFLASAELRGRGAVSTLALALGILLVPRANLHLHVADHAAIAFGLLSCWCLARFPHPGKTRLATVAALCVLAIWSKQIAVFLVPAQLAFLLLGRERAAALRYILWVAGLSLLALGVAVWAFGFANLWLGLVEIPGRLPWANIPDRLASRLWPLAGQLVLPAVGLLLLWRRGLWPTREQESGRFFQLAVLMAGAMFPVGLAAFLKVGGDLNLLHSWDYLVPGCLLLWLVRDGFAPAAPLRLLGVTALVLVTLHQADFTAPLARPVTGHFTAAVRLTATYPRAIWFPMNPVITFYSDHALWHSEDGILTRNLAGYGLRESEFRRHLPPNLQAVAYPSGATAFFALPLLPELSVTTREPYWTLHTRPQP